MQQGIHVAGSIIVDMIYETAAYPARGELSRILKVEKSCGGLVPNVAVDLKKIDPSLKVCAGGRLGDDDNGRFVLDSLRSAGVLVEDVAIEKGGVTSFTCVISESGGERTFFNYPGTSARFGLPDVPLRRIDCRMYHLGYFLLLDKVDAGDGEAILRNLQAMGIRTSIDLVTENAGRYEMVRPCLRYVDNLIVNEMEAARLAGMSYRGNNIEDIMRVLKGYGVRERVIVHMPQKGCLLSDRGFIESMSLDLPDGYIRGATGAGDAYCAGALYGIYENWDDARILQFAGECGAVSLSSVDATGAMCTAEEIEEQCKRFKRRC